MVVLAGVLQKLSSCRVMLVGDLAVDRYTFGEVKRISPEAPVPVLRMHREEWRPGMSGNVVRNLLDLGAKVTLVSQVGDDQAGSDLLKRLRERKVATDGIMVHKGYITPVKNRLIANEQQIVRVDREHPLPLPAKLESELISRLPSLMEGIDIVAISDYAKGLLSEALLQAVIVCARDQGIPVVVDPKGADFTKYRGATVIKPNYSEAVLASGCDEGAPIKTVAAAILKKTQADTLFITRSKNGISTFEADGTQQDFPVEVREVKDVTGAGDTVLSVITVALASGLTLAETAMVANIAAGLAVEHVGCVSVTLSQIARRLLECDSSNKIFDSKHLPTLQQALKGRKPILLEVSGDSSGITAELMETIEASASENSELVVYVSPGVNTSRTAKTVASLQLVDFVVVDLPHLSILVDALRPLHVVESAHFYA